MTVTMVTEVETSKVRGGLVGGKPSETVIFSIDGIAYEVDLNAQDAAALRQVLAKFITHGRALKPRSSGGRPPYGDSASIRSWAAAHGIHVAKRGRLAQHVINQYLAAQQIWTPAAPYAR